MPLRLHAAAFEDLYARLNRRCYVVPDPLQFLYDDPNGADREIVALVAQGFKNKEMAEKMFISEQTVKNHLHNIFDKLGVSDRLELALYAIHNNLHTGR